MHSQNEPPASTTHMALLEPAEQGEQQPGGERMSLQARQETRTHSAAASDGLLPHEQQTNDTALAANDKALIPVHNNSSAGGLSGVAIARLMSKVAAFDAELLSLRREREEAVLAQRASQEACRQLEAQLTQAKQAQRASVAAHKDELAAVAAQVAFVSAARDELTHQVEMQRGEMAALANSRDEGVTKLRQALAAANTQAATKEAERATAVLAASQQGALVDALEAELTRLQAQVDDVRKAIKTQQSAMSKHSAQVTAALATQEEAMAEVQRRDTAIQSLQTKLAESAAQEASLKQARAEQEAQLQAAVQAQASLNRQLLEQAQTLDHMAKSKNDLVSLLASSEVCVGQLRQDVARASTSLQGLHTRMDQERDEHAEQLNKLRNAADAATQALQAAHSRAAVAEARAAAAEMEAATAAVLRSVREDTEQERGVNTEQGIIVRGDTEQGQQQQQSLQPPLSSTQAQQAHTTTPPTQQAHTPALIQAQPTPVLTLNQAQPTPVPTLNQAQPTPAPTLNQAQLTPAQTLNQAQTAQPTPAPTLNQAAAAHQPTPLAPAQQAPIQTPTQAPPGAVISGFFSSVNRLTTKSAGPVLPARSGSKQQHSQHSGSKRKAFVAENSTAATDNNTAVNANTNSPNTTNSPNATAPATNPHNTNSPNTTNTAAANIHNTNSPNTMNTNNTAANHNTNNNTNSPNNTAAASGRKTRSEHNNTNKAGRGRGRGRAAAAPTKAAVGRAGVTLLPPPTATHAPAAQPLANTATPTATNTAGAATPTAANTAAHAEALLSSEPQAPSNNNALSPTNLRSHQHPHTASPHDQKQQVREWSEVRTFSIPSTVPSKKSGSSGAAHKKKGSGEAAVHSALPPHSIHASVDNAAPQSIAAAVTESVTAHRRGSGSAANEKGSGQAVSGNGEGVCGSGNGQTERHSDGNGQMAERHRGGVREGSVRDSGQMAERLSAARVSECDVQQNSGQSGKEQAMKKRGRGDQENRSGGGKTPTKRARFDEGEGGVVVIQEQLQNKQQGGRQEEGLGVSAPTDHTAPITAPDHTVAQAAGLVPSHAEQEQQGSAQQESETAGASHKKRKADQGSASAGGGMFGFATLGCSSEEE